MPGTTIRGVSGAILWVYHRAASVASWELTATNTGGTLSATVTEADSFKLAQPGLTFRVQRQNGPAFVWPVLSLLVDGSALHAQLGPQE